MKDDNRTELAAIPIVLALLGVLFAIMLLVHGSSTATGFHH